MTDTERHTQGIADWVTTRDGRRLYAMWLPGPDTGDQATPTVVFEAGAGASRSSWALVQPEVARHTRAIVYDRSGLGNSAPTASERTLSAMADDLNDVLDHFEPGPFLLVGHSAGGPIVRLAAARRPDRIAGLVLVDPTDEAAASLFGKGFRRAERRMIATAAVLARLGLLKMLYRKQIRSSPPDVRRDLAREGFGPGVVRTMRRQAHTFLDELAVWRANPPEDAGVPVTVISGGRAGDGMNATWRAEANAAHAHRAATAHRGRYVVAERSAHTVPLTEPAVIVREVAALLP
ncbi:alpha/beta fold hydrolase [Nocardia brasiliensis]|uniref:Alpha/beta fold hydrolase n=1 Tax=Nocardia brasiliensis TaxID=37326 RepID=A0A6G9XQR6_NOCBR|nr:alpha/beta hydrolase [Nocardia brasiliensis]QIS03292.1 alpha/beta fold hydrolase [Nocardia brasiliensis]